ncbi:uncharacterized protein C19orf44 homolog isoform X1 [Hoplias malabaricus]|uniref:uncharacterized protein C19orf44 homolog isoform X1 n=1 Tax=Hoplias malabaricus TaxID=27720 RepID=UPI0034626AA9
MWNRGSSRSAALERAKAQLSGRRLTSSGTGKNTRSSTRNANLGNDMLQARLAPLHGLSDLSSEDAESEDNDHNDLPKVQPQIAVSLDSQFVIGGGSRFLKKPGSSATADRQLLGTGRASADASALKLVPQGSSQGVELSSLVLTEEHIRNHKNKKLGPDTRTELTESQKPVISVQSSNKLSMAGSKFFKKNISSLVDQKDEDSTPVGCSKAPTWMASHTESDLDSDEEDMRRLLGESVDSQNGSLTNVQRQSSQMISEYKEMSPVSSAFTAHRHKIPSSPPSSPEGLSASRSGPLRPVVTQVSMNSATVHRQVRSLGEPFSYVSNDDTLSKTSVASNDFKLNVMTLDDLAPVAFETTEMSKEKANKSPRGFEEFKPSSAETISLTDRCKEALVEYESDFESEIQTETALSANEVSKYFSGGDKYSSSMATQPQSHSSSSHSNDKHTLSENLSKSSNDNYSKSESSLSPSKSSNTRSYTSDATITQNEPRSAGRPVKDATVQTQRDGLTCTWYSGQAVPGPSVGMSYADPTLVASHTISAEAVEALSAYSPAVFALNDMLKQQLALTRSFIESSRHLHHNIMESLGPADYRYTTLEETKEFIFCNSSPKLTMEDALEEVMQEMREYHYI